MKKTTLFLLGLMICAALLLSCADDDFDGPPETDQRSLYVFGDSWADQMDDEVFPQELADRGFGETVELIPVGIGGTTMRNWGKDEDGMLSELMEELSSDPNPNPIVFFTLGGNDMLEQGSADSVPDDMRALLTQLEESRDDLQIVFAQYDIMSPSIEPEECSGMFTSIFNTSDPAELNQIWLDFYVETEAVAAEFERVTSVNTYGSLQGNPGSPDLASWSPVEYFSDCIHLNEEGYDVYLDTVFDEALTPMLE